MVTVRAGKFMMRLITFAVVVDGGDGKGLEWEEARKKVFRGITAVEGTPEEFERINEMLRRYPVFKEFGIVEE